MADSKLSEIEKQISAGQYYKAISGLDKLLAKDPHNPNYQFNRALALSGSGQIDKAIKQYQALIKAYPDLPESYNNLAVIYLQQGKKELARTTLEKALQAHQGYAQVYKNLQQLNSARARDAYARALQIPAKKQARGLQSADKLVLQQAAVASVRPAPVVTKSTNSVVKSGMRYQAKNQPADRKNRDTEKQQDKQTSGYQEASQVLNQWARAWTSKDAEQYIQFYSKDYSPPEISRGVWEQQRRERIRKPRWIRVKLRNIKLHSNRSGNLIIRLEQEYAADNYRDVTQKEFIMSKLSGEWRIVKERGLGYLRQ
ncbi:MAG: tetratricopeptide repeat protein [Gammaproteobacteria bacterium]|nr:tetratricopeptide repeat protein [Gammaproteobacteria bacterium]